LSQLERRALQFAVALACLVPVSAGLAGVVLGPRLVGAFAVGPSDLDSHFRYLSGLLLAIGVAFASTIPRIEMRGGRFRLLTFVVVVGGLGRLLGSLTVGRPSLVMVAALAMELIVTPGLTLWQYRVARMETTGPGTQPN
jgi:hypothetical protein